MVTTEYLNQETKSQVKPVNHLPEGSLLQSSSDWFQMKTADT